MYSLIYLFYETCAERAGDRQGDGARGDYGDEFFSYSWGEGGRGGDSAASYADARAGGGIVCRAGRAVADNRLDCYRKRPAIVTSSELCAGWQHRYILD